MLKQRERRCREGTESRTDSTKGRDSRSIFGENARVASLRTRQDEAYRYSLELAPVIRELMASGARSLGQIASGLNAKGVPAPRGGRWRKAQVDRIMRRLLPCITASPSQPPPVLAQAEQASKLQQNPRVLSCMEYLIVKQTHRNHRRSYGDVCHTTSQIRR